MLSLLLLNCHCRERSAKNGRVDLSKESFGLDKFCRVGPRCDKVTNGSKQKARSSTLLLLWTKELAVTTAAVAVVVVEKKPNHQHVKGEHLAGVICDASGHCRRAPITLCASHSSTVHERACQFLEDDAGRTHARGTVCYLLMFLRGVGCAMPEIDSSFTSLLNFPFLVGPGFEIF
jgi:hypothetical protein